MILSYSSRHCKAQPDPNLLLFHLTTTYSSSSTLDANKSQSVSFLQPTGAPPHSVLDSASGPVPDSILRQSDVRLGLPPARSPARQIRPPTARRRPRHTGATPTPPPHHRTSTETRPRHRLTRPDRNSRPKPLVINHLVTLQYHFYKRLP